MRRLVLALGLVACEASAPPAVSPPAPAPPLPPTCVSTDASAAPVAVADAAPPPPAEEIAARATKGESELAIVRRKDGIVARWKIGDGSRETKLNGADDAVAFKIVDLNGDDFWDVLVDHGGPAPEHARFSAYASANELSGVPSIDTYEDRLVWRWIGAASTLDAAASAIAAAPRVDLSPAEACGALERNHTPVEAWLESQVGEAPYLWKHSPKKRMITWRCSRYVEDGKDNYWVPEIACSKLVPACEGTFRTHGGTTMPEIRQFFFDRVKGKLEVVGTGGALDR